MREALAPLAPGLAPSTLTYAQFARGLAPLAPLGAPGAKTRYLRVLHEVARFTSLANYLTAVERLRGSAKGCQGCQALTDLRLLGVNPGAKGANPKATAVRR